MCAFCCCSTCYNTAPTKFHQSNTLRCRFCSFQARYFDKILVDISSDQLGFWSHQSKDHSDAILQSIWVHVGGHVHGPIYLMSTLGLMFFAPTFFWLAAPHKTEGNCSAAVPLMTTRGWDNPTLAYKDFEAKEPKWRQVASVRTSPSGSFCFFLCVSA